MYREYAQACLEIIPKHNLGLQCLVLMLYDVLCACPNMVRVYADMPSVPVCSTHLRSNSKGHWS